jgi:hypothetical protein
MSIVSVPGISSSLGISLGFSLGFSLGITLLAFNLGSLNYGKSIAVKATVYTTFR